MQLVLVCDGLGGGGADSRSKIGNGTRDLGTVDTRYCAHVEQQSN